MTEYIVELPDGSVADEFVAKMGVEDCRIYGYRLTGEIVRCRDCRYYKCGDAGWWCLRSISTKSNHPDGFCAWGEKRES